jgi:drug/metabolite transporter (DMT)-like permease
MSSQLTGMLIGGLAAAICFGLSAVFAKVAMKAGIGLGPYIISNGLGFIIVGIFFWSIFPDTTVSIQSGFLSLVMGILAGMATGFVAMALVHYNIPLGKLVPLYNMNTLIAVLLALWLFAEWKQVHTMQLLIGSALIVVGGTLVARA